MPALFSNVISSQDGRTLTVRLDNGFAVGLRFEPTMTADDIAAALGELASQVQAASHMPPLTAPTFAYAGATHIDFNAFIRDEPLPEWCRRGDFSRRAT